MSRFRQAKMLSPDWQTMEERKMKGTILVGTASQGFLRSVDDGASWHRLGLKEAIEFDGVVRSVVVHPHDPKTILAGADSGLCISTDGGAHFSLVDSPMNGQAVWSIAIDPANPSYIYAGTGAPSRAAMFRSTDSGKSWQRLSPEIPEFCQGVNRPQTREEGVSRQLPHLGDDGRGVNRPQAREPGVCDDERVFHPMTMPEVRRWFAFLAARLRHVRSTICPGKDTTCSGD